MSQCAKNISPRSPCGWFHTVLQKGAQVYKAKAGRTRTKGTRRDIQGNCTTLDANTAVWGLFFFFLRSLLNAYKKINFPPLSLFKAVQTTRASWLSSTSMICHREKSAPRDESTWIAVDVWMAVCTELGINGTDRLQQLVQGSRCSPLHKQCGVVSWQFCVAAAENSLSLLEWKKLG